MESVTVQDVNKNDRGWYEIEVAEYDEPLATKEKGVADAAFASVGQAVMVDVRVKENGGFTNRYLNKIEPTNGAAPATAPAREIPNSSSARAETQERIARQWAFGRSVELLIASGEKIVLPLTGDQFSKVQITADTLLLATGSPSS